MEVRQCDFCRMPYHSTGKKICADCFLKIDKDFFVVRDYLYEHEGAGIEEVADATGVSRKSILFMLKEERLTVTTSEGGNAGILACESCKKPISTGRMCPSCKNKVLSAIQDSVGPVRKPKRAVEEDIEEEYLRGVAKLQVK